MDKSFKDKWKFNYKDLLSKGNNLKLNKSEIATYGLNLTPDNVTCQNAKLAGCMKTCIVDSGHAKVFKKINQARTNRKKLFYQNTDLFMQCLIDNIENAINKNSEKIAFRLNMFSDIQFENVKYKGLNIYQIFKDSNVQFYDYTKIFERFTNLEKMHLLDICHLTFSYMPNPLFAKELNKAMKTDMNIAFIYNGNMPETFLNRKVVNGDLSDYRPLEGYNKLAIALKYKSTKHDSQKSNIII